MEHLAMTRADANELHARYYKDYGLAIEGLVRHHRVDPLEYNSKVDDALPLEQVIFSDPQLRQLLEQFDKSKVKLWLFTNAYINHGKRVVKLLGVGDLFEGITYCDYGAANFVCKPHNEMFQKAMYEAGISDPRKCYFVGQSSSRSSLDTSAENAPTDDSALNCRAAHALGWKTAHLVEPGEPKPAIQASEFEISSLQELRSCFPSLFKS